MQNSGGGRKGGSGGGETTKQSQLRWGKVIKYNQQQE